MQIAHTITDLWREIPFLSRMGTVIFAVGSISAVYVGFKANGWRSIIPFQGLESALKIYRVLIKRGQARAWPFWLWICCQPLGALLAFAGIVVNISGSHR